MASFTHLSPIRSNVAVVALALLLSACGSGEMAGGTSTSTSLESSDSTAIESVALCTTPDLTVSAPEGDATGDQRQVTLALENSSRSTCRLHGTANVSAFAGETLIVESAEPAPGVEQSGSVILESSERAYFDFRYSAAASGSEQCPEITRLVVTPPGETTRTLVLPLTNVSIERLCPSGSTTVSELRSTPNQ